MNTTKYTTSNFNSAGLDASQLCSRKLWQLVSGNVTGRVKDSDHDKISDKDLSAAIEELAKRRHYLEELQKIGKLRAGSSH